MNGETSAAEAAAVVKEEEENGDGKKQQNLMCPRCQSTNTKFCYFNNYNMSQPRHFCKTCRRYWTKGGSLRNIPVGGNSRKKRAFLGGNAGTAGNNSNRELGGGENRTARRVVMNSHLTARSGGMALMMVSSSITPTLTPTPNPASILGHVGLDIMGSGGRRFGHLLEGNRDYGNLLCPSAGVGQMQITPTVNSDNSGEINNNNSFIESPSVSTYHFPPHDDFTFWSTGGGVGSNGTTGSGTGTGNGNGGGLWSDVPPRF